MGRRESIRDFMATHMDIPLSVPVLRSGDVHIWWTSLDHLGSRLQEYEQVLSADERARADSFRFERDRNRFIAKRGMLKEILGYYLGVEANTIRFDYGTNGKPRIGDYYPGGAIEFNVSHSEGIALYGFCRDHQIGVDIEYRRDFPEMGRLAELFFSKGEKELVGTLGGAEKVDAFFRCWTRKEAITKATGVGLSYPLNSLDVLTDPVGRPQALKIDGSLERTTKWSIRDLTLCSGFAAAFAVEQRPGQLPCYRCTNGSWAPIQQRVSQ
jgi:4'-phosphopantetheinyl transferase